MKLSDEEKNMLRAIGEQEAKEEREKQKTAVRKTHWEQKAIERTQVGQQALYLKSGVTFSQYQEAYIWGVKQIVAQKMQPIVAERAVAERFKAKISRDVMRIAAKKFKYVEQVQPLQRVGKPGVLPLEIKEGLVEIVEMMQGLSLPFPVYKSWIIERAQFLIQGVPEFQEFWAARDNAPTNRWYKG